MFWILLPYIFAGLFFILYAAVAVVLVVKWLRTRDTGIAWLGIAVVIWPLIMRLLAWGETIQVRRLVRHQPVGFFPFSLVEHGQATIWGLVRTLEWSQQIVGVCFLLVAVIYLYRGVKSSPIGTQAAPSNSEV